MGRGNVGPNLSGLLSGHYPKSYARGEQWTPRNLERWLENPRKSRPLAKMQPLKLKPVDFNQLLSILSADERVSSRHIP
jgi:cytochrome c2